MRHMIFVGCVIGIVSMLTIRSLTMFSRLRRKGVNRQTSVLLTGIDIVSMCAASVVAILVLTLVGKYVL